MAERVASSSRASRPVVGTALLLALVPLTACGPVEIDTPDLDDADAAACADFVAALPATLSDEESVEITPEDAPGRAYGDPAIVVTCGVGAPEGFGPDSQCEEVDGEGWYIPDEQYEDASLDLVLTSAGTRPRVEVQVPAEYRPEGPAAVMGVLSPLVAEHLEIVDRCV